MALEDFDLEKVSWWEERAGGADEEVDVCRGAGRGQGVIVCEGGDAEVFFGRALVDCCCGSWGR